jgi:hypothetical protein
MLQLYWLEQNVLNFEEQDGILPKGIFLLKILQKCIVSQNISIKMYDFKVRDGTKFLIFDK